MSGELVRFSLDDHVATITINRPEVRNALNRAAYRELEEAFAEAQRDPEVRAVVLTGADPSFCSGDDVKQIMLGEERPTLDRLRAVRGTRRRPRSRSSSATAPSSPPSTGRRSAGEWTSRCSRTSASPPSAPASASCS